MGQLIHNYLDRNENYNFISALQLSMFSAAIPAEDHGLPGHSLAPVFLCPNYIKLLLLFKISH